MASKATHTAKKQKVEEVCEFYYDFHSVALLDAWLRSEIATLDPEDDISPKERRKYCKVLDEWRADLRSNTRRRNRAGQYFLRRVTLDPEYKRETILYESHCNWQILFLMIALDCDMPITESFYHNYPEAPLV
jgi:hypothetical protein